MSQSGSNTPSNAAAPVVGFSVGSDSCCIAIYKDGRPFVVTNEFGDRTTPTCVSFSEPEEPMVGVFAKQELIRNPQNTISKFLNLLGKRYEDIDGSYAFEIVDQDGEPVIAMEIDGKTLEYTITQIMTKVFRVLKQTTEGFLGHRIEEICLSVPVHFSHAQRDSLLLAASKADLTVTGMITEPVAAALAFGYGSDVNATDEILLVFDLGGSTLTVTILKSFGGIFEEVISRHDGNLGGIKFDELVRNHFTNELKRKHRIDISENRRARAKLLMACEQVKRTLSQSMTAACTVDSIHDGFDFHGNMNRSLFDATTAPLTNKCVEFVLETLKEASLETKDISGVLMIGGSSAMLNMQQALKNVFQGKNIRVNTNPDETIACGSVMHGVILQDQTDVDPSVLHVDTLVLPHSIGVAAANDKFVPILQQFSPLPVHRILSIPSTAFPGRSCEFFVYSGENEIASKNTLLAHVALPSIPEDTKTLLLSLDLDIDGSFHFVVQSGSEKLCTVVIPPNNANKASVTEVGN